MERQGVQISLTAMMVLVACVAVNLWLFRVGVMWGFAGLYVVKHVVIAYLCQIIGVNRRIAPTGEVPSSVSLADQPPQQG